MSLNRYCQDRRFVILDSSANAYEAVRALEPNHVGAVLVQDDGRLSGIVTDRDLARRIIGFELSARETPLRDVMTPGPSTVSVSDSEEAAGKLMCARHVRHIPIVDDGRIQGIVTLDDLIMSGTTDPVLLAEIVEAQLAEPAVGKPGGLPHPRRNAST